MADKSTLVPILKKELLENGFFHCNFVLNPTLFEELAASLGPLLSDFQVLIDSNRKNYVCKPEAIPFHTDDQTNRYMAWHCLAQDDSDGSSRLIDIRSILAQFSDNEIDALKSIHIETPHYVKTAGGPIQQPLMLERSWGWGVSYSPWLKPSITSSSYAIKIFEKFSSSIEAADRTDEKITSIRMSEGEALFIDNARMLHGRKPVPPNSRRHLRRLWIGLP